MPRPRRGGARNVDESLREEEEEEENKKLQAALERTKLEVFFLYDSLAWS